MGDLTFTEEEHKKTVDFVNLVLTKAKWDLTTSEAINLNNSFEHMRQLISKIYSHILEIKKVTKASK